MAADRSRSARATTGSLGRVGRFAGAVQGPPPRRTDVLRESNEMSKGRVLSELWEFLRQEKKYWLVPIVVVFVLFGLLLVFSQSSAIAPFIYSLF
jgi:hypothetical protein